MTTLRELRKAQGLTVRALAERAGCSYPLITYMEHGYRPPHSQAPAAIAKVLGVRVGDLFANSD